MNEETKYYYEHQNLRKKIYMDVWVAISTKATNMDSPNRWAERALNQFDEQFPMPALPFQPISHNPHTHMPYPYSPFYVTSEQGQYEKDFSHICTPPYFMQGFGLSGNTNETAEKNIFSNTKTEE